MANWTDIATASLEVGAPARSVDVIAMRDNIIAQSEGALGAPKTLSDAVADGAITNSKHGALSVTSDKIMQRNINQLHLLSPIAGTANLICRALELEVSSTSTVYETVARSNIFVDGVVTAYLQHLSLDGESSVRLLKDGSQVALWTTSSPTYAIKTFNVAVSTGSLLEFQMKTNGIASTSKIKMCRIYSGTNVIAAS